MRYFLTLVVALLALQGSFAPPVTKEKEEEKENEVQETEDLNLEYGRYLQEVVSALESDQTFRARLMAANDSEIRSGKIAYDLDLVNHQVRSKLDELKRNEIDRLRQLATEQFERENGLDKDHMKIMEKHEHLDHKNPHTFEISDLKKLIAKVTKDLDEADKKRREEFKEYEMHKKFEQEQKMKNMTEEDKKKFEHELEEMDKKHKDHAPLHHPGSKKQLEEVWEKQDHMENQEFDPKAFFHYHDLDGNGVWDENELKTLFLQELHKLYEEGHPEDDINEKAEELERMREHVLKEADLNGDRLISFDEFLTQSKKTEFEQDPGWETLDQQQIYSEQEYEAYKQAVEKAIAKGMSPELASQLAAQQQFPPHPNEIPQHMQQPDQYHHQQQYPHGQYPGQVPHQQYPGQFDHHQGGYQQQAHPQQPQYGQVPQQHHQQQQPQYHPNDVNYQHPSQNQNFNQQLPVGHVPPQVPQQQYQQQQHHQQPPQAQNAIPQQQQFQQPPPAQNAIPQQQQFQQPPPAQNAIPQQPPAQNAIPQQKQFQQPPPAQNAIPQQQQFQQPPPAQNAVPQQQQFQQPPPAQNAIPQQQQPPAASNDVKQAPPPQAQQNHPSADTIHGSNAGQSQH